MRKFLVFPDHPPIELSPITYEEFTLEGSWRGSNDTAYAAWLRYHKFEDPSLDSFNKDMDSDWYQALIVIKDEPCKELSFDPNVYMES